MCGGVCVMYRGGAHRRDPKRGGAAWPAEVGCRVEYVGCTEEELTGETQSEEELRGLRRWDVGWSMCDVQRRSSQARPKARRSCVACGGGMEGGVCVMYRGGAHRRDPKR